VFLLEGTRSEKLAARPHRRASYKEGTLYVWRPGPAGAERAGSQGFKGRHSAERHIRNLIPGLGHLLENPVV